MNLVICEDSEKLAQDAMNWCSDRVVRLQARSMFLPAGNTPIPLYALWERKHPDFLNGLELFQIDDVLTGQSRGVFKDFFFTHLPSYRVQLRPIDLGERCADLAVLGLGLNGHVAFHEPGIDKDLWSGCIPLSSTTCKNLGLEPKTWGITYGTAAFLRAKAVLMIVTGTSKRPILQTLMSGSVDANVPATNLLAHPDFTIIADRAAAGG